MESRKNSTDEPIQREEMGMQMQRTDLWTLWGKESIDPAEKAALTYKHYHVQNR